MQGRGGRAAVAMGRAGYFAEQEEASGGQGRRPWTRSFLGSPSHLVAPDLIPGLAFGRSRPSSWHRLAAGTRIEDTFPGILWDLPSPEVTGNETSCQQVIIFSFQ